MARPDRAVAGGRCAAQSRHGAPVARSVSRGLDYELWCLQQAAGERELDSIRVELAAIRRSPLISVVLVAGALDELWVAEGVDSLARQSYRTGSSAPPSSGPARRSMTRSRHGCRTRTGSGTASAPVERRTPRPRSPSALARQGDYVLVLDEGDELSRDALLRVVDAIDATGADLRVLERGPDRRAGASLGARSSSPASRRIACLRAPTSGACARSGRELVEEAGAFSRRSGRSPSTTCLLRVAERARRVAHLPQILYHRRVLADANRRIVWATGSTRRRGCGGGRRRGCPRAPRRGRRPRAPIASRDAARVIRQAPVDARVGADPALRPADRRDAAARVSSNAGRWSGSTR